MKHDIFNSKFARDIFIDRYSLDKQETWKDTCKRVVEAVCSSLSSEEKQNIFDIIYNREFIPGGRYLYAAGRPYHQICNCFCFRAEDSREGWADLMNKITVTLMSGGGIGIDYSDLRGSGQLIKRTGGISSGPIAAMHMVNECGRFIVQGGSRRSAIWAGMRWNHPDILTFINLKNHSKEYTDIKKMNINFPLPMEGTNISVVYDTEFFVAMENHKHPLHNKAKEIWDLNCLQAFSTGEPGFSLNFMKDNESLRNACCEVVSEDDSDRCNLGSVWINRIPNRAQLKHVIKYATLFLLMGGKYTDSPTQKIKEIGIKNNRIGLGLGGLHEWLLTRNEEYYVTPELHKWLNVYEQESNEAAYIQSKQLGLSRPKGIRAIAPTGTIGILAESTTGIEPIFCKSYIRKYTKDNVWVNQYVVDPTVKRLVESGIKLQNIKDAYDLSFKQRVKFQADVQNYVDMSISSTCNIPSWETEKNNKDSVKEKSEVLLSYAKRLRGFTCYPDGAREGQPLERVDIKEALEKEGVIYEEKEDRCVGGVCGI